MTHLVSGQDGPRWRRRARRFGQGQQAVKAAAATVGFADSVRVGDDERDAATEADFAGALDLLDKVDALASRGRVRRDLLRILSGLGIRVKGTSSQFYVKVFWSFICTFALECRRGRRLYSLLPLSEATSATPPPRQTLPVPLIFWTVLPGDEVRHLCRVRCVPRADVLQPPYRSSRLRSGSRPRPRPARPRSKSRAAIRGLQNISPRNTTDSTEMTHLARRLCPEDQGHRQSLPRWRRRARRFGQGQQAVKVELR
jgi:hypothetical protein